MERHTILVVEPDEEERRRISGWLDDPSLDVMFCPGPCEPDFTCIGGRGASCPLAAVADVVVLNLRLRSDEAMAGTPGWELMLYYREQGLPIVAVSGDDDAVRPRSDALVSVVPRPLRREALEDAIEMRLRAREAGREP